ncbi:DMT family transporter [Rheinheimera sp.]|uniref:DMT family transporter n=1 Tax=Rheinheimera sp. TaxID=1869214 RepID=UPI00307EC123
MPLWKTALLTVLALITFAGNSLLCRAALLQTDTDPATFTSLRLLSGALVLWLLVLFSRGRSGAKGSGSWFSALALFVYAVGFSFSYVELSTATGALILFGAVQISMIGYGLYRGERLHLLQLSGMLLACAGLVGLLLPGLSAPPLMPSLWMVLSGVAWALYSLRGRGVANPLQHTAGNFMLAVPMGLALGLVCWPELSYDTPGMVYAVLSGALTSGLGYALWYAVLPSLKATTAATVQLSVPVIAAFAAVVFLQEAISLRLAVASIVVLGGIALVLQKPAKGKQST